MSTSNPRLDRLKSMLSLEEKRVALQQQLDAIHNQLSALKDKLFDDAPVAVAKLVSASAKPVIKKTRKGRAQRGALKARIVSALQSAGNTGVRVTELAAALGTKAANVHAWFHSTAKSVPGIVKISGGHYRLDGGKAAVAKVAKPAPPATKAKKPTKRKGTKRGQLTAKIQAALTAAGKNGLSIKDLAGKVGAKYRNVSVWLVTTGKNFPKIKKTGPAHYRLVD